MDCRVFWLAKSGDRPEDWEDAYAADSTRGRFALADGATDSVYAKGWAQLLVNAFVEAADDNPDQWLASLPRLQQDWQAKFHSRPLPWYIEAKLERGAFATFLGVVLTISQEGVYHWRAIAVGDTCLFHTRAGQLLHSFPIQKSDRFGNFPFLVGSKTSTDEVREKRLMSCQGIAQVNDRLWMMTDALAQYSLASHEAGDNPWESMEGFAQPATAQEEFSSWITQLRCTRRLRNDDATLLVVRF